MPYFVPTPDAGQWFYWVRPGGQDPLISVWPKANSARADCRFGFKIQKGAFRTAGRWAVELDVRSGPLEELIRGWMDLEALAEDHLFGSAGISDSDWECTLDIQAYEDIPVFGGPGVITIQRWERDGGTDWIQHKRYYLEDTFSAWRLSISLTNDGAWFSERTVSVSLISTVIGQDTISVADCYNFPPGTLFEQGHCACNGVDAYILFDDIFPLVATRFKMEFEIRPRSPTQQIVAQGLTTFSGNFYGFNLHDNFRWWTLGIPLSSPLTVDVWQTIRCEYDWSIPGAAYNVWIDDVLKGTLAAGFITWVWDEIGRRGTTISGDFDIRSIRMFDNTPASPNLLVDVPLDIDACAVEPIARKGTTFNMDLPSCP